MSLLADPDPLALLRERWAGLDLMRPATPGQLAALITDGRELQAPHLDLIDQAIVDASNGTNDRTGIFMPPRHGKSQRVRWAALWYLQRHPDRRVVIASYGAELATDHGRWLRDTIAEHGAKLGLTLRPSSKAAHRWDTDKGGGLIAVGIGGSLTGRGAHLLIVDDPVKDAADADSPTIRRRTWEWWQSTALTRLEPGGARILVQTRWHEDDLAGRVLAQESDRWRLLTCPALADDNDLLGRQPGEPLWPARYDRKALDAIRLDRGGRVWAALYQQRPTPPEGAVWRWDWISPYRERIGELPQLLRSNVSVDPSATSGENADDCGITVNACGYSLDRQPQLHGYVLDDRTTHGTPLDWGIAAVHAAVDWDVDEFIAEANQGGEMVELTLRTAWNHVRRQRTDARSRLMPPVRLVHVRRGKRLRAEPVAALYEAGRIHHVGEFPELEQELTGWVGEGESPNRLDSITQGLTGLLLEADGSAPAVRSGERWQGRRAYR